ncbi:general stress protein [Paenibacillus senegalensis]|uniref:general stress protein n=1 Tax=Paenibacillus senegalensis TaxID=1465766 RepID=UPI000288250A|nr:general stress protein [Paenibacillus senegalensis]
METNKVVGVLQSEQDAIKVIDELQKQGYRASDISVITKRKKEEEAIRKQTASEAEDGIATGAAAGGIVGGVTGLLAGLGALAIPGVGPIIAAGPIAAALSGAVIGAGTGGLVGGLIALGIAKSDAEDYSQFVDEGNILIIVEADPDRRSKVAETFRRYQAVNKEQLAKIHGRA